LHPANQVAAHIAVGILCEVGKISKTAVLNFSLVIPIIDLTISMVMSGLVERVYGTVISSNWTNMICYDIYHYPNVASVTGCNEINQILL
jgi:hypothetical protein